MTILYMHVCQKNASAPLFNIKTLLFSWNLPFNLCYTESNPRLAWCFAVQWNINWFQLCTSIGCWTWAECHYYFFFSTAVWNSAKYAFQYANRTMRKEKEENNRERSNNYYSLYNRIFMAVHQSSFQPHWAGLNLSGTLSFTPHFLKGCEICISNTNSNDDIKVTIISIVIFKSQFKKLTC